MQTAKIEMEALIADPECAYYVANKKGKTLSYTQVKAQSFVVVDKKGKLTVSTTVDGKALAEPVLYVQKNETDGVVRYAPQQYTIATRVNFNGRPLVDVFLVTDLESGRACIEYGTSDTDFKTGRDYNHNSGVFVNYGDSVMNIKQGKYPITHIVSEYKGKSDKGESKYDHWVVIDLGLEMSKDFIPVHDIGRSHPEIKSDRYSEGIEHMERIDQTEWKRFFAGDGHKMIPSKETADKALNILKKAFADIDKLGCEIFFDSREMCASVLRKIPDNLVLDQEQIDDHKDDFSTIPLSALTSFLPHCALLDTNNDYAFYVKKREQK